MKTVSDSYLTQLWGRAVKMVMPYDFLTKAFSDTLEAHHVIRRSKYVTRWDWRNGVSLSPESHRYAHANPLEFAELLRKEYPYYDYLIKQSKILKPDYLKREGITDNEFRQKLKITLVSIINNKETKYYTHNYRINYPWREDE